MKDDKNPGRKGNPYRLVGLDGLRAIAAIAVLLYHLLPGSFSGGYLGVDVFFVLSGFLITALLVKEKMCSGSIKLGRFWLRRLRRLYPAVILAVCVSAPIAYLIDSDLLAGGRRQILSGLTYTFNWADIYSGSDYFDKGFPELFKNLWTLALEQQFYLFWPLVILSLSLGSKVITSDSRIKIRPYAKNLLWPLLLAGISFLAFALIYPANPNRAYMGTDTHLFGLMLGASLAMGIDNPLSRGRTSPSLAHAPNAKTRFINKTRAIGAFISLILLLFTCVYASDDQYLPYWSGVASLATLGVIQGLVIQLPERFSQILGKVLDQPILRYIGERSYGIYLWHWPILIMAKACFPGNNSVFFILMVVGITLGIAALSYRYVETPIRRYGLGTALKQWARINSAKGGRKIRITLLIASFTLGGIGLGFAYVNAPAVSSLKLAQQKAAKASKLPAKKPKESTEKSPQVKVEAQIKGENITIIGDSVTQMVAPALSQTWPGVLVDGLKNRAALHGEEIIEYYANNGNLRHYVVVSLANNGAYPRENVEHWLKQIGKDRVLILVTGFGPEQSQWIFDNNRTIYELQAAYPQQIVVAEWDKLIAPHQDLLYLDLVHPRPEGEYLYIAAIQNALNQAQFYAQSVIDPRNAKYPPEVQKQIDTKIKEQKLAEEKARKQARKDKPKKAKLESGKPRTN